LKPAAAMAVIDWLAGADGREQLGMFHVVHVRAGFLVVPVGFALDAVVAQIASAIGAEDVIVGVTMAIGLVAREAENSHTVLILENGRLVVELVAELRLVRGLASSQAVYSARRLVAERPRRFVDAVIQ